MMVANVNMRYKLRILISAVNKSERIPSPLPDITIIKVIYFTHCFVLGHFRVSSRQITEKVKESSQINLFQ